MYMGMNLNAVQKFWPVKFISMPQVPRRVPKRMDVVNETSQGLFLSMFATGIKMEQQPQHRISRSIFQTLETLLQKIYACNI